jgi:hypothetical protein
LNNGRRQASVRGTPAEFAIRPVVKLFDPNGPSIWLITGIDPDHEMVAHGLCDLGEGNPKYVAIDLATLIAYRSPFNLRIERDRLFRGRAPISDYIAAAVKAGRIVNIHATPK